MKSKYKDLNLGKIEAVFNKLGGIEGADRFLRGELELVEKVLKKHLIDCDAQPFVPESWEVVEHQPGGPFDSTQDKQFEWDPGKVELYLCDEQKKGSIEGNELRKKLKGKPVMNANVLDYLLAHPELIPEEWKGKYIFFWGTIYRHSSGRLYVRYLRWRGDEWDWGFDWLGLHWDDNNPALLRK